MMGGSGRGTAVSMAAARAAAAAASAATAVAAAAVAVIVLVAGCGSSVRDAVTGASPSDGRAPTIVAVLGDPGLQTMRDAVRTAGLQERLNGPGPFTLIAPDDDAFGVMPADELGRVRVDRRRARALVLDCLLPGALPQAEVRDGLQCRTMVADDSISEAGHRVSWTVDDGRLCVDGAAVTDVVTAANGIVYVVDRVLPPAPEVWAVPSRASPGDRVAVVCRWTDPDGAPVAGARCLFVWHFGTSQPHVTRFTDGAGTARCVMRVPASVGVDDVLVAVTASGRRPTRTVVATFTVR